MYFPTTLVSVNNPSLQKSRVNISIPINQCKYMQCIHLSLQILVLTLSFTWCLSLWPFLPRGIIQFETKTNLITNTMSVYVQNLINILFFFRPSFRHNNQQHDHILHFSVALDMLPSFYFYFIFSKLHYAFPVLYPFTRIPLLRHFISAIVAGDLFMRTNDKQTSPLRIRRSLPSTILSFIFSPSHIRLMLPMRRTVFS